MPLFKGKGCKSTPGKAIAYITDENKAEIVSSQNLDDNQDYAQQFRETADLYGKGEKFDERKYYHFKLSCNRADEVSAEAHHEFAEAMAARCFPEFECVIATHTDTETVHSHIIVNAISFENGMKLHCNIREYGQMKDLANKLGAERGFTELNWRQATQEKRQRIAQGEIKPVLQTEKYMQQSVNWERRSWKEQLRVVIDEAKNSCCNRREFTDYLKSYGVQMPRNTEKSVSFIHPAVSKKSVRGNVLGEKYTAQAIDAALQQNLERSLEHARYDVAQNTDRQRGIAADSRTEAVGNREYVAESSVGAVERTMRGIAEGVFRRTSDGRAAMARQAAAEQRAAEEAARRAEQERKRELEQLEQEHREIEKRQRKSLTHDFGPTL